MNVENAFDAQLIFFQNDLHEGLTSTTLLTSTPGGKTFLLQATKLEKAKTIEKASQTKSEAQIFPAKNSPKSQKKKKIAESC